MLLSTVSANIEERIHQEVKQVKYVYTPKLDIKEPSLTPAPIFRVLDNTGEIVNNCNLVVVSTLPCINMLV